MIVLKTTLVAIILFLIYVIVGVYTVIKANKNLVKFLRLVLFLLITIMLFNLGYKIPHRTENINVVFMVDNSYSMSINNRLQKIKNFLKKYEKIKKHVFKIYTFNDELYETKSLEEISISNRTTLINSCIDKLLSEINQPSLVFLFSDGINSTNELPSIKKEKAKVIPIFIYDENFKDKSILDIRYSKLAFKNVEYELKAYIYNWGYKDTTEINLVDLETNEIIFKNNFYLKEGKNEIIIKFLPKKIGYNKLKLELKPSIDEANYENNYAFLNIEVKKNKIRVLYLCGQPSAEYFNLRSLLKNDPYIDLVSFVILRNPDDISIVSDIDSALIPFPTYDIFIKELNSFDLVIFENFTYHRFGIPLEYLENLKKFVISGGGFIMIGGLNSFFLGGYKFTPLEEILPVYLSEKEQFIYEEIKPDYVNLNDKLTKILEDTTENELLWKNLPSLGNYQTISAKEDAIVLLKYKNIPIMCYAKKNKGRVFVSATNSTWRWRIGNVLSERFNFKDLYDKFWKKVIYFCAGTEDLKNISIISDEVYKKNEEVEINILLSNISNIISIDSYLILPDSSKKILKIKKLQKDRYSINFIPNIVGKYNITVVVKTPTSFLKEEKSIDIVESNYKEISYLKPDIDYMQKLADFYNSEVKNLNTLDIFEIISNFKKEFSKSYAETIWLYKHEFLFFIFIVVFILEIYIARFK
ncbi:MAG: glutamine amidotransferase [Endomicrobiia bacterium]